MAPFRHTSLTRLTISFFHSVPSGRGGRHALAFVRSSCARASEAEARRRRARPGAPQSPRRREATCLMLTGSRLQWSVGPDDHNVLREWLSRTSICICIQLGIMRGRECRRQKATASKLCLAAAALGSCLTLGPLHHASDLLARPLEALLVLARLRALASGDDPAEEVVLRWGKEEELVNSGRRTGRGKRSNALRPSRRGRSRPRRLRTDNEERREQSQRARAIVSLKARPDVPSP
jgi:hypothetical protein